VNRRHFAGVIEAARILQIRLTRVKVVISTHPGDLNPLEAYQDLSKGSTVPVVFFSGKAGKDQVKAAELVPGADIIIGSTSSIPEIGAYQQIPVICFLTEAALVRHEKASGSRDVEACKRGIAVQVIDDVDKLANVTDALLDSSSRQARCLREVQIAAYPNPPKPGTAVRLMADYLERLVTAM